ncbi:MFS transporter [Micrococcus sp.]|uniref:MFS transporter n=1 Tax=Micrococcus sp. TaxID=1271 RepID=UPI002A9152C5|nr:MFS transporter [Micrococcus sp.]
MPPTPSDPLEPGTAAYRRLLLGLFLAGLATFAQLYAPQALLPLVGRDLGVPPHQAALLVSAATLGLALSVLPWSLAGDRWGRRTAVGCSVILASALSLTVWLVPALGGMIALRVVEGAAHGGVAGLAVALLVEEITPRAVPQAAGTYVAGVTLGGLLGRLVALPLGEALGWRGGLLTVSALGLACAVGALLVTPAQRAFAPASLSPRRLARTVLQHLRSVELVAVYLQATLLMGGFVALYNYLGFTLLAAPFSWPVWAVGLVFIAYLAGTFSSPLAGRLAARRGRLPVLTGATCLFVAGACLTLVPSSWAVVAGVVVATGGFFAAHAVASAWAGTTPTQGRAQSTSLYTLAYYIGSSVFGWVGGLVHVAAGWTGTVLMVIGLALTALMIAAVALRGGPRGRLAG